MELDQVYRLYFQDVELFLRGLTGSESLAEELTQEAFFRSLRQLDQLPQEPGCPGLAVCGGPPTAGIPTAARQNTPSRWNRKRPWSARSRMWRAAGGSGGGVYGASVPASAAGAV